MSAEVTFRKKGNEKQYRFNESLQEQFHVAGMRRSYVCPPCAATVAANTNGNTRRYSLTEASLEGYQAGRPL